MKKDKKIVAAIIVGASALLVIGGVIFKNSRQKPTKEVVFEDEKVAEIPPALRPYTTLTPTSDGHWLNLSINLKEVNATSLDYELVYQAKSGTQGGSGVVKLTGDKLIERKLLLGSESSGKFRYDEEVSEGTLTLKFRNDKGKLVGRLMTSFHMQSQDEELNSIDGEFRYTLKTTPKKGYFITMNTLGLPVDPPEGKSIDNISGPFGIFASEPAVLYPGTVEIETQNDTLLYSDGKWQTLEGNSSPTTGLFIGFK